MKSFIHLASGLIICVLASTVQTLYAQDNTHSSSISESISRQARDAIISGDTARAMEILDNGLETSPADYELRHMRGQIFLVRGNFDSAEKDFTSLTISGQTGLKARAHAGLGHILVSNPQTMDKALKHYREAVKLDPTSFETLYDPAFAGYLWNGLAGRRLASEALVRLICFEPLHPNAYRTWRDFELDKKGSEILKVDKMLENFLKTHPDSASWWVDLAGDRFYLGRTSLALQTLDKMASANPNYISPAIPLLRARCALDGGDTRGFHENYQKAVLTAESTGDFTLLFRQAEPLFTPACYRMWEKCQTASSRAVFFRRFWGTLNPDPLAAVNPRLATHYNRLRLVEKQLQLHLPNVPYQPSLAMHCQEIAQYLFRHCRNGVNFNHIWFIGHSSSDSTGRAQAEMSDILELLQKQYDVDEGVVSTGMLTSAFFCPSNPGNVEIELYQGGIQRSKSTPKAEIAIFDSTWKELARQEGKVYPGAEVYNTFDKTWFAVHRLEFPPGNYWFAVRTQTKEELYWIARGMLVLRDFDRKSLDLSGVVLGSLPPEDNESYSRDGIAVVPRPSRRFKQGEALSILFEIYNLGLNQDSARVYDEEVNVTLVEDNINKWKNLAGGYVRSKNLDPNKSTTSLHHRFVRTPKSTVGPVAEFFSIDTSQLQPGNYRMVIDIKDESNGANKQADCIFELEKQ